MEGSTVSDFSIERILSPQFGRRPPAKDFSPGRFSPDRFSPGRFSPGRFLQQVAVEGLCPCPGCLRPPAPVPVPVPVPASSCLQFGGMSFGDTCYYGSGISRFYPSSGMWVHVSSRESGVDAQLSPGYHGHAHSSVPALQPPRQKARMRTVFTDTQSKHLEALFHITDYPAVEARAGVARSTGLSEETIRVWFKNRRARRKRQHSGSKVKSS
ncbi:dharma [Pleuronectes platessa]|uniref:dharma n=1 Tax=Pleuronectes platessa TaxID=8262 RepID=UPI00232A26CF|nr:dharma [Pleuronectes platessa]